MMKFSVIQMPNTKWVAVWREFIDGRTPGEVMAFSNQEHDDRSDAVQEAIDICHWGIKSPLTMRKAPKWRKAGEASRTLAFLAV